MIIKPIVDKKPANNAISESRNGPNLTNGPLSNHVLNLLDHVVKALSQIYTGKFCRIARVTADDVIGVAK
jgi:hypothetical protein